MLFTLICVLRPGQSRRLADAELRERVLSRRAGRVGGGERLYREGRAAAGVGVAEDHAALGRTLAGHVEPAPPGRQQVRVVLYCGRGW